jgi:hypothetical protein
MTTPDRFASAYRREGEYVRDTQKGGVQTARGREFFKRQYSMRTCINRARLLQARLRDAGSRAQEVLENSIASGFWYNGKFLPKVTIGG